MRFSVYSQDGTVKYTGSPTYNGQYLNVSYLEFDEIASPVPIEWEVGDYIDYTRTGLRYRLYSLPQPKKQSRRNTYGAAFVYSNVQFYESTKQLEIAPLRDLVGNDNLVHFSTSSTLTSFGNVSKFVSIIQASADAFYPNKWVIKVAEGLSDTIQKIINEEKEFSVNDVSCLGALNKIYEMWDGIGWIHTYENGKDVITVGKPNERTSGNTTGRFLYGKGKGLTAIKKSINNLDTIATRLYVYGSERNIPNRYYNGKNIKNADSVNITNLMLPINAVESLDWNGWGKTDNLPDARLAYLQADDDTVDKIGLISRTVRFDGSDDNDDIYPSIEGMTIKDVRLGKQALGETDYVPSATVYTDENARVDKVLSAVNPIDRGIPTADGTKYISDGEMNVPTISVNCNKNVIKYYPLASDITLGYSASAIDFNTDIEGTITTSASLSSIKIKVMVYDGFDGVVYPTTGIFSSSNATITQVSSGVYSFKISAFTITALSNDSDTSIPNNLNYGDKISPVLYVYADADSAVSIPATTVEYGIIQRIQSYFKLRLRQIGFNIHNQIATNNAKGSVYMKSGSCGGYYFPINKIVYEEATDSWLLTMGRYQDGNHGVYYPNSDSVISAEDQFVLQDLYMPELYIKTAENRLLAAAKDLLEECSTIQPFYEPEIDAKQIILSSEVLKEGMYMHIEDSDITDGAEYIMIDSLRIVENEASIPTYHVTLSNVKKKSFVDRVNKSLSNLRSQVYHYTETSPQKSSMRYSSAVDKPSINGTILEGNINIEDVGGASQESLDKVEDNVGTSVAIYDAESKRFVLSGVSLNPRSLTNCRYVFKMDKAVTELPESRSSAILSIGGFVNGIKWRGKNATPSNTWEEGAWVDAWYYDGSWYMTYANTRVSYEIWGEETIIVKPTN